MVPAEVVVLDKLPMLGTGKIDMVGRGEIREGARGCGTKRAGG